MKLETGQGKISERTGCSSSVERWAGGPAGSFVTNLVTDEVLNSFEDGSNDPLRNAMRNARKKVLEEEGKKRYWGAEDVRGCLFVVLTTPDGAIKAGMHIPFNAADDKESFDSTLVTLFSPFFSSQENITCYLVGGFEEETSVDTLGAIVDSINRKFKNVDYNTVDVLRRKSGERRPLFDTETRKMFQIKHS